MNERKYVSTYQLMKAGPCNVCACNRDGHCESCNYGGIRTQAAIDHNLIMGLRKYLSSVCPRFKANKMCYYVDTGCDYKEFCPNCRKGIRT